MSAEILDIDGFPICARCKRNIRLVGKHQECPERQWGPTIPLRMTPAQRKELLPVGHPLNPADGDPVNNPPDSVKTVKTDVKTDEGFDKKAYQREYMKEYMRKRREK